MNVARLPDAVGESVFVRLISKAEVEPPQGSVPHSFFH
jgi:hypothetical protein